MDILRITLTLSTLLCTLVAGLVFAFAIVVMPGIRNLNDHNYLQAFKVIDSVIQNNQPLFILMWLGSVLSLVTVTVLGVVQLNGADRLLVIVAALTYLIGVQLPTVIVNVPLNNQLQVQDLDSMTKIELGEARSHFETRWIRWNSIRTVFAILASVLLIVLCLRL